jgi:hypothetical protein
MLSCIIVIACISVAGAATIPNPTVTGPIASDALGSPSHNYPFLATNLDLMSYGYVEEEYFLQGTANNYNTSSTADATIKTSANPYKIRIVVRRPILAENFNGAVFVDWMNVTNGFEYDTQWARAYDYFMRTGAIYVGAGVQRVGQVGSTTPNYGLKTWSPARYGSLDLTVGGTLNDDSLKYDAFSQVAQALRAPVGIDPLHGMRPQVLIATGDSQSATNLAMYANSVHPLAPIFDAFVPLGNLNTVIRTDIMTKYFKVNSEYDVLSRDAKVRRPDTDKFVTWEVAGASHSDLHNWLYGNAIRNRDLGYLGYVYPGPDYANCMLRSRSSVHYFMVIQAAFDHAIHWVSEGIQPPAAPPIEVVDVTATPVLAVRDEYGIAKGGIRLADVVVPISLNTGWDLGIARTYDSTCGQNGVWIPFLESDQQTVNLPISRAADGSIAMSQTYLLPALEELYRNHGSYVSKVSQVTQQNVKAGYLLKEDGQIIQQEVAHSPIGK